LSYVGKSRIRKDISLFVFTAVLACNTPASMRSCVAQTISAQSGGSKRLPEFEVASIRASKQDGSSWGCLPGGRITGVQTLAGLITLAYDGVRADHIVNLPKWGDSDRYAISAIPPESSQSSKIQFRTVYPSEEQQQMLQSLLAARFHLKIHRDFTKEQAYLISLKETPAAMKLQPPKDEHMPSYVSVHINDLKSGAISFVVLNSTMSIFAREVGRYTKLNVIDRTGLTGPYDFRVPFVYIQDEPGSDFGASVLTGLRAFGFDIKSAKTPIEHFVIDHVDRPTEN
jgi:uncharacterized protein (TIGR03435 family)